MTTKKAKDIVRGDIIARRANPWMKRSAETAVVTNAYQLTGDGLTGISAETSSGYFFTLLREGSELVEVIS